VFAIGVGCRVGCEAAVTGSLLALGMLLPYSTTPPDGAAHMVAVDGRTADGLSSAGDELGTRQVFGHLSLVQTLSDLSLQLDFNYTYRQRNTPCVACLRVYVCIYW
jgi:hypothetical protein